MWQCATCGKQFTHTPFREDKGLYYCSGDCWFPLWK